MGRTRIYKDNAEKQRAYRQRKRLAQGKTIVVNQRQPLTQEELFEPENADTRLWDWKKWVLHFYHEELEEYEEELYHALDNYIRLIFNVPRQHGKTTRILRRFVVRKLCETRFTEIDENIIYFSSSKINIADFIVLVADDLEYNEAIIENYGYLLEKETKEEVREIKRRRMRSMRTKQTSFILNINTRRQLFNHSLQTITLRGQIRGKGSTRTLVDDPVDVFHTETPEHVRKLTTKIFNFLQAKLFPASHGNTSLVGTRYDTRGHDIFTMCAEESGGRIWRHIEKRAVYTYGDYSIRDLKENEKLRPSDINIHDPSEWQILSIGAWEFRAIRYRLLFNMECTYLQACIYMKETMTKHYWEQEFQNNPMAVSTQLRWHWLKDYESLTYPGWTYNWAVMVDVAAGESKGADYTAMVLVGEKDNRFFIHDIIYGKWTGKEKQDKLENFISLHNERLGKAVTIKVLIETVRAQRDFYQRVRDESHLTPKAMNPAKRKDKETRITHGLGQEMENGQVYINVFCRNKTQLRGEMEGFPLTNDDHIIDATDQAVHYLKGFKRDPRVKPGWL